MFSNRLLGPEKAATVAALAALFLAVSKSLLFIVTGSLVVAVSAWDSAMDFIVSLVNRKTLVFARQAPDADHPYGHGKAESIASLGQGALLFGGALTIVGASAESLFRLFPDGSLEGESTWFAVLFFLGAALVSMLITGWLTVHARHHNSPALLADSEHYRGDVFANLGSAVGLSLVALTNVAWLDPLIASLFALKIAHSGYRLLRRSVDELMDHDVGDELKRDVQIHAKKLIPEIVDIHRFRGRRSGSHYLLDFHVTLPNHLSFHDVHQKVEDLEEELKREFNADVVIHADPDESEQGAQQPIKSS